MAKYNPLLWVGLLLAIASCERPAPPVTDSAGQASYNLTAYLQQQKEALEAEKPMVLKSVETQGKDAELVETSEVDWEDELTVFEQADLNRPSLQEYYTKQQQTLSDGSVQVEYSKLEDAEPQVHYLRLVLTPNGKLKELTATLQDQNIIYYSHRKIALTTNPKTGSIASYRVDGVQKMIFGDSLHYSVKANL
ncbi:hypothetical protein [Pontibacter oryzae]|uniref:Uncharacterized protein n=1 Tax=Pontibacter oryzae TaxID=2304593 RepID=A0A399S0P7_9BACT|nr:hypothetical protein [Pontibacter oryzae]RIJ37576.1 hypothetical protein D1627_10735 [Pontibacter oryzae]